MADATTEKDVYIKLREYLDELPAGYPETPTGVELRLLERIFTPEEAELFLSCKLVAEPPAVIAERAGIPEAEAAGMLPRMARKGHLFPVDSGDHTLYMALPWMPGIIETQIKIMDEDFARMFTEHSKYFFPSWTALDNQMFRVVPVESAIEAAPAVETYDRIRDQVKQQKQISVMSCLCRATQGTLGERLRGPPRFVFRVRAVLEAFRGERGRPLHRRRRGSAHPRQGREGRPGHTAGKRPRAQRHVHLLFLLLPDAQKPAQPAEPGRSGAVKLPGEDRPQAVQRLPELPRALPDGRHGRGRRIHGGRPGEVHRLRAVRVELSRECRIACPQGETVECPPTSSTP